VLFEQLNNVNWAWFCGQIGQFSAIHMTTALYFVLPIFGGVVIPRWLKLFPVRPEGEFVTPLWLLSTCFLSVLAFASDDFRYRFR
jgi:hypothetical protein